MTLRSLQEFNSLTIALRKGKTATPAQKKNLKNARAAHINPFVTKTIALYDHAIGNTATITTSKYTNRRNELIDEVRKYIASYNKPSGFKRDRSETAASDLTSKRAKKAAPLMPSQPYLDPFGQKIGPNRKLLLTDLTPSKVSAYQASV
ncbi:hypothetical protein HBI88_238480 [Parastagonospora nodorum]|nr:hypothetical protein HBI93_248240 [Parastagonospora nodorum]KAH5894904.1 hypothetical protein HBI88_238480 [Parastagonospora nodorum]KAH5903971.1 hypothetical protein HBI89_125060 [Parastagonospora nodorum]KAH5949932.1 hypothetical protein HBI87_105340 [Parastagonospora nodorum]KAH5976224.1 hypothetical protein HBI85_009280 [Parastagonospora nodorum]